MVNNAYFKISKSACLYILTHESHLIFWLFKEKWFFYMTLDWKLFNVATQKLEFDTSLHKKIIHFLVLVLTKYHKHLKMITNMWSNKTLRFIQYISIFIHPLIGFIIVVIFRRTTSRDCIILIPYWRYSVATSYDVERRSNKL